MVGFLSTWPIKRPLPGQLVEPSSVSWATPVLRRTGNDRNGVSVPPPGKGPHLPEAVGEDLSTYWRKPHRVPQA